MSSAGVRHVSPAGRIASWASCAFLTFLPSAAARPAGTAAEELGDLRASGAERRVGQRRRVGAHVGDVAALVEPLRDAHHLRALMRSLRPPSCCRVDVMNGGFGRERYGFSRRSGPRSRCARAVRQAAGERLVEDAHVVTLECDRSRRSRCPSRHARLSNATSEAVNARIGRERRFEVPVAGGDEAHALPLALDDEPRRGALHATGRQPCVDLLPADRRDLVAVEAVEDAPGLVRVDQAVVDAARAATASSIAERVISWNTIRFTGTRGLEHLEQVPRDGFAFAVFVGGEVQLVGVLQRGPQLLHHFLAGVSPRRSA